MGLAAPRAREPVAAHDGVMSENTSDDTSTPTGDVPNPETGVGIGAGEPSGFEPEEDPEAVPDDPQD